MRRQARILIADDDEASILVLEAILRRAGYSGCIGTTQALQVVPLCLKSSPDLLLLDIHMPGLDAFGIIEELRADIPPEAFPPVMIMTGDVTPAMRHRALAAGAQGFMLKPVQATEVVLHVRHLLELRSAYLAGKQHAAYLAEIGEAPIIYEPDEPAADIADLPPFVIDAPDEIPAPVDPHAPIPVAAPAGLAAHIEALRATLRTPEQFEALALLGEFTRHDEAEPATVVRLSVVK